MSGGCDDCGKISSVYCNVEGDKLCSLCAENWKVGHVVDLEETAEGTKQMNVLVQLWINDCRVDRTHIPCQICGGPTSFLGTKLCDGCWEVTSRLSSFLSNQNAIDFVKSELGR